VEKIVTKPMKIDFHIHSYFSKFKDEFSLVEKGTKENLSILLNKLEHNHINMCAITDHDYFSYELYEKLKSYESKAGELEKVFPGVEFSVGFKADDNSMKPVHIICIFDDDNNEEKVQHIQDHIPFKDNKVQYDVENEKFFSEEKFISILRDIDLNVVMIAHQKQSISSGSASKSKNDVSSLGAVKFNELIGCEYFESFEFKSMKNGLFNNNYALQKNKNYDQIRFITGSDCHNWEFYPKHDPKEDDEIGFEFTYLKCLPCFRGLAMAFSDTRRISTTNNIFGNRQKMIDNISMSLNGQNYNIPLSPGINVIIGDNSIGKSLLLHKMTNYKNLLMDNKTKIQEGYEKYLEKNNIGINTKIDINNIHTFDYQGSIRDKFAKDNQDNSDFLENKFPADIDAGPYKMKINSEFEKLYSCIEFKFAYDEIYKTLNSLKMIDEEVVSKNLTARIIRPNQEMIKRTKKLMNYYKGIIAKIDADYHLILENEEKIIIDSFRKQLLEFESKYEKLMKEEEFIYTIKVNIDNGIKKFNDEVKGWKTNLEFTKNQFDVVDSNNIANVITELVKLKKEIKSFKFDVPEEILEPEKLNFGEYMFIKKFKNCVAINNKYLQGVLERVLKNKAKIDTSTITKDELKNIILNFGDANGSALDVLKEKIGLIIEDDLKSIPSITINGKDVYSKLSSGMNSSIYFDILSTDQKEGVYIVDQPEDDISQSGIKSNVLNNFKTMSNNRQIIMITHNPQFVVNLDVDNVICLTKDSEEKLCIKHGALEYVNKDDNTDILDTVAKNLDGGIDSIKKRWKRYEKTVSIN